MAKTKAHKNTIMFEIKGTRITADKFTHSVKTFFDLINDVAIDVVGKRRAIEWVVTLKHGSIALCATAEPIDASCRDGVNTIKAIERGIRAVFKKDKKRPPHFSDNALKKLLTLGDIVGLGEQGIEHVHICTNGKPYEISPSTVAHVDNLLHTPTKAFGTIEGYLLALELRGKLKFEIDEILSRNRVKCFFDDEIYNDVIKGLRQRVSVYGLINYHKGGIPARIDIKGLTIFPPQSELPQFKDIIGILKD